MPQATPLLEVHNLKVYYPIRTAFWQQKQAVRAVDGVSFVINRGETVGLVGESGCGKSTLGRAIVRLENPTAGEILFDGQDIASLKGSALRSARKNFQMIFQDPYGSLNPRLTIAFALEEVLKLHTALDREGRRKRILELLDLVGLPAAAARRYPHQFSGGQRQRIGIARALAAEPQLIVADEPVSALDVSVQAQIINLLEDIQKELHTAFLFIAHDLGVVEHISNRILVMYLGKIVEAGPARELCATPQHPYTQALLSAVPTLAPQDREQRIMLTGDVPSPLAPPAGCSFHPRCRFKTPQCETACPVLTDRGNQRFCACFHPLSQGELCK